MALSFPFLTILLDQSTSTGTEKGFMSSARSARLARRVALKAWVHSGETWRLGTGRYWDAGYQYLGSRQCDRDRNLVPCKQAKRSGLAVIGAM